MLWKTGVIVFLAAVFAVQVLGTGENRSPGFGDTTRSKSKNIQDIGQECRDVQSFFVKHKIGHRALVPESKVHDPEMEVCYNGQTDSHIQMCCSHKMEKKYTEAAEKDFYDLVQTTSSYLKNLIATNSAQYQGEFLSMLRNAENETNDLFRIVYNIGVKDRQPLLKSLFLDLQQFIEHHDVNIHESVTQFFDDLFPLVFHSVLLDPTTTELDDDYRECLMEVRQQVYPHPFGEVPHNLSRQLSDAFSDARLFLEALALAVESINTTDHILLDTPCTKGLMRMKYCSHCRGYVAARPCKNFCINVMRGCLAKLQSLDTHWNSFVDAMQGMEHIMKGPASIETALEELDSQISTAIMHAMKNSHKFFGKVTMRCGNPRTLNGQPGPKPVHRPPKPVVKLPSSSPSHLRLDQRVAMFMRNLQSSKGFYHGLADTICTNDEFAVQSPADKNCWNGKTIGGYHKNVTELTMDAQLINNPEVRVSSRADLTLTALEGKLARLTKRLKPNKKLEKSQDDSYVINFNGRSSGDGHDDEDYDYGGSGSGSGDQFYRTPGNSKHPYGLGNHGDDNDGFVIDEPNTDGVYNPRPNPGGNYGNVNSDPSKRDSGCSTVHSNSMIFAVTLFYLGIWLNG